MKELRVDPIACDGHGLCAELFPEGITLDDWGFPIVDGRCPPGAREAGAARRERLPDAGAPPASGSPTTLPIGTLAM